MATLFLMCESIGMQLHPRALIVVQDLGTGGVIGWSVPIPSSWKPNPCRKSPSRRGHPPSSFQEPKQSIMVLLLGKRTLYYCSPFLLLGVSWAFHNAVPLSHHHQQEQRSRLRYQQYDPQPLFAGRTSRTSRPGGRSSARRTAYRHDRGGVMILPAGGFAWEDPVEIDSGVENPYKNVDLLGTAPDDGDDAAAANLKIDPARLLSPRLNGSNLYLIGMMGTGKSTIGSILARRMGTYTFLDTDDIIVKAAGGTSIPDLFATEGEEGFRTIESQVLDAVHPYVRCVISTGGGIVCKTGNWSKLQTGIVVWLNVPPPVIMERIRDGTNRPLLLQNDDPLGTLERLLAERLDRYQQADVHVSVDESMNEHDVANAIIRQLHDFLDDHPPAWKLAKQKAQAEGLDWVK
jgi:shikimate kinase